MFASVIMKTNKEFHIVSAMKVFTVQIVKFPMLISLIVQARFLEHKASVLIQIQMKSVLGSAHAKKRKTMQTGASVIISIMMAIKLTIGIPPIQMGRSSLEIGVSAINGFVGRRKWNVRIEDTAPVIHMTQTLSHDVNATKDFLVHTVNRVRNQKPLQQPLQQTLLFLLTPIKTVLTMEMIPMMTMMEYQMFLKLNIPVPMLVHGNLLMIQGRHSVHVLKSISYAVSKLSVICGAVVLPVRYGLEQSYSKHDETGMRQR